MNNHSKCNGFSASDRLDLAVSAVIPDVMHALAPHETTRPLRRLRAELSIPEQDMRIFRALATASKRRRSVASVISQILVLVARAMRTGRDPITGEPITWKNAYADRTKADALAEAINGSKDMSGRVGRAKSRGRELMRERRLVLAELGVQE